MARTKGPRKVHRYSSEFKLKAVQFSDLAGVQVKDVAHIAVGLAYLATAPLSEATERMRQSLPRFVGPQSVSAYHETLTVFWIRLLDHLAVARYAELPLWQRVNAVIVSYGTKWPVEAHYSGEATASSSAREFWVEPDLRPLLF